MQGEFDEKEFEFVRETGGEKSRIGSEEISGGKSRIGVKK